MTNEGSNHARSQAVGRGRNCPILPAFGHFYEPKLNDHPADCFYFPLRRAIHNKSWQFFKNRIELLVVMPKTAPAFPQRRILVVDDEPFVCDAVKMMLNFDGHVVETASNGKDALAMFEEGKFDLVMTDWKMPGMKGDELAAAIKARAPNQPVVMITAHAESLQSS